MSAQDKKKDFTIAATGDGKTDDWEAIQNTILNACDSATNEDSCCVPWVDGACRIVFPTPKRYYRVSKPILIPGSKALALVGTARNAVAIRLLAVADEPAPAYPYVFMVEKASGVNSLTPEHPCLFERLSLIGGGIAFLKGGRGSKSLRECTFLGSKSWAVIDEAGAETQSIGGEIADCIIYKCAKGVCIGQAPAGTWNIRRSRFDQNFGLDLEILGSGCHVSDCDFEGKAAGSKAAFIAIKGSGGDLRFNDVRLGGSANVPTDFVRLGPDNEWTSAPIADVQFVGCDLHGAVSTDAWGHPAPSEDEARAALRLAAPTQGLQLRSCTTGGFLAIVSEHGFQMALVAQSAGDPGTTPKQAAYGEACYDNVIAHHFERIPSRVVASAGGRGFEVFGRALRERMARSAEPERSGGNLLVSSEPSPPEWGGWHFDDVKLTLGKPVDSPLPAPQEWSIDVGVSGVELRQLLEVEAVDFANRPAVFSAWFRTDSSSVPLSFVHMRVLYGSVTIGGSAEIRLPVGAEWVRHFVLVEQVPEEAVNSLAVSIVFGDPAKPALRMRGPQFEVGPIPTAYNPSAGSSPHEKRQNQSLVVGPIVIGYAWSVMEGPADVDGELVAPSNWRAGDGLINLRAASGTPDGWVCVEHAGVKTWHSYGDTK